MKSVAIVESTHSHLKKLSSNLDMTQGDFIAHAVEYFKKTGINPSEPIQSPREELTKVNKRINDVIAFIRTQESLYLKPILEASVKELAAQRQKSVSEGDEKQTDDLLIYLKNTNELVDMIITLTGITIQVNPFSKKYLECTTYSEKIAFFKKFILMINNKLEGLAIELSSRAR